MRAEFAAVAAIVVAAVVVVRFLDDAAPAPAPQSAGVFSAQSAGGDAWDEVVRIKAAPDHHFYVRADINRRSANFLVDTGASYVALRDSVAREAGIYTSWADYTYPVKTANGETRAALVTIDEIEIEGLRVEGVRAFILQDEQLAINLLGMSFLSRLESVEARRGEMILRG